jgi:hypothetical protein
VRELLFDYRFVLARYWPDVVPATSNGGQFLQSTVILSHQFECLFLLLSSNDVDMTATSKCASRAVTV